MRNLTKIAIEKLKIIFLFLTIFTGNFSFDRLVSLNFPYINSFPFVLQFQLWFAIITYLLVILQYQKTKKDFGKCHADAYKYTVSLFIFNIILIVNILMFGGEQSDHYLFSIVYIVVVSPLCILCFLEKRNIVYLLYISEFVSIILFLLCIFGFNSFEHETASWSPIGTSFSTARLFALSFISGLFLYQEKKPIISKINIFHCIVSYISAFSLFMTFSKAAALSIFITTIFFAILYSITKKYFRICIILSIVFLAFSSFSWIGGWLILKSRFNAVMIEEVQMSETQDISGLLDKIFDLYKKDTLRFEDFSAKQKKYIEVRCDFEMSLSKYPSETQAIKGCLRALNRSVELSDQSDRIKLYLTAFNNFAKSEHKFGIGLASFKVQSIDMYNHEIIEYYYPHNIFLEIASGTGVFGLSVFLLVLFYISVIVIRIILLEVYRGNYEAVYLIGYLVFIVSTAFYAGNYYDFRIFWFISLVVAATYSEPEKFQKITRLKNLLS